MERYNGMICIDKLPVIDTFYDRYKKILRFVYNNKVYYYKEISSVQEIYNELIAEEIAKDFGISHVSYDLAYYDINDSIGVISEDFINNKTFIYMEQILISVYGKDLLNEVNNLTDIWNALCIYYKDIDLANKLYNQIIELFIFDVLIANSDRHDSNYGFEEDNGNINLGKVFDNGEMLNTMSIYEGYYRIGIDRSDTYTYSTNLLRKLIKVSDSNIRELLKSKMEIISEDNIEKIIDRVENKINHKIEESIKFKIIKKFSENRKMINMIIQESYTYKI